MPVQQSISGGYYGFVDYDGHLRFTQHEILTTGKLVYVQNRHPLAQAYYETRYPVGSDLVMLLEFVIVCLGVAAGAAVAWYAWRLYGI
jgi:hypothetical protein